jgi:LCP family protein required for cell wall assembly
MTTGTVPAGGAPSQEAPAARVRRRPPIKVIVLGVMLLLLIGLAVGGILLWQRVAAFNDTVSSAPAASSALWGPLGGDERVNVAFYGYGGPTHKSGNYLADSIQILSIDPKADTTTVIPIPRDFWIEGLPQMPDNGKINEAFAIGYQRGGLEKAGELATEILSEVTGLEIKYWVAIDFEGFKEMIDSVGGVTVMNPRGFRYTWSEQSYLRGHFHSGKFPEGELELDGEEALAYTRARYTSDIREASDFARSLRQQRVMSALRAKLGSGLGSIGPGLGLMDALNGRMRTNLSAFDLFLLSGHLEADQRLALKEGRVLEATGNTLGQYILVVVGRESSTDYGPLQRFLARQLAKPIPIPTATASAAP